MSVTDWQMQIDIQRDMERSKQSVPVTEKKQEVEMATKWIKPIGEIFPTPFVGTHAIIARRDNDGVSLYTSHAMFDTVHMNGELVKCFTLMDDGIGEIITLDKIVAYTTYDTNELKGI